MTEPEKIKIVNTLTGSDDSEETVTTYLEIAAHKILRRAFPYDAAKSQVPDKYAMLQCEIASYLLNKRGAEGQVSHSENGVSRGYEKADVPDSMLSAVVPYCGVIK